MPFKTKRQKIAASQRRFTFSEEEINLKGKSDRLTLPNQTEVQKVTIGSLVQAGDLQYVRRDVLKTIVIAALIVIFQVFVYLRVG